MQNIQRLNVWIMKEIGSSGLCPLASGYKQLPPGPIHPVRVTNSLWLARGRGVSWDAALSLLQLRMSRSNNELVTLYPVKTSACLTQRKPLQVPVGGFAVCVSFPRGSQSLCRILSQLSSLSSQLPLSGTLELGPTSKVILLGLFHWWTCSLGSPGLPVAAL